MDVPQNPAGAFEPEQNYSAQRRDQFIVEIEAGPLRMRNAVAGLSEKQLETRYRNWSIRQIVHHVADSHVNSYVRFKWALTEDRPTIKAYDEGKWVALADSSSGSIDAPLALLEGLHLSWVGLLRCMSSDQFLRTFVHPESGKTISLADALCYYAWHCRHHTGQIVWLRGERGW